MVEDTIVQFVCFETAMDENAFVDRWKKYSSSEQSTQNTCLYQSASGNSYKYVSVHKCANGQFNFEFKKGRNPTPQPETEIRGRQAGGYSLLQEDRKGGELRKKECRLFVFINSPQHSLQELKTLKAECEVNIYEAYFENCAYNYIAEYYVNENIVPDLLDEMKSLHITGTGIYTQCKLN